jgi:hypothetical protein
MNEMSIACVLKNRGLDGNGKCVLNQTYTHTHTHTHTHSSSKQMLKQCYELILYKWGKSTSWDSHEKRRKKS